MSKTKVKCDSCGNEFEKENKEINRCKKEKMGNFCNRGCVATYKNLNLPADHYKKLYKKYPVFKGYENNRKNELSPFKIYLNKGRASIKKHLDSINIDANYLKQLWESQNGLCPYTGIKMLLPDSSSKYHSIKSLKKASLDRIDSNKGYIKGNVEFVCYAINLAKNNHKKEEMIMFIKEIKLP